MAHTSGRLTKSFPGGRGGGHHGGWSITQREFLGFLSRDIFHRSFKGKDMDQMYEEVVRRRVFKYPRNSWESRRISLQASVDKDPRIWNNHWVSWEPLSKLIFSDIRSNWFSLDSVVANRSIVFWPRLSTAQKPWNVQILVFLEDCLPILPNKNILRNTGEIRLRSVKCEVLASMSLLHGLDLSSWKEVYLA